MDKITLRREMLARTAALSPEYIIESDLGIFENVVTLPEFISAGAVFMYYSFDKEPDTHGLVLRALEDGKTVALPRVLGSGKMEHLRIINPEDTSAGVFGIREPLEWAERVTPKEGDIIIVPAAAYGRDCSRLGRGGGYYDRFLRDTPAFTVGLSREKLLIDHAPEEPHDVRVKCVVTESGIIRR